MKKMGLIDKSSQCLLFFNFWENYEDIEKFAEVLCKEFSAKTLEKISGPDARVWRLSIDGNEVLLINDDPYGNHLRADTESAIVVLKHMLPKLERIFNTIQTF